MIDLTETIDRMFEAGRPSGTQLQFRICDKSVLLPLPQLLDAASHKAGRTISEAELRIMAGQGWLPLLPGAGIDGNEEGAPIYVPDRVGLFMKLQRQGYTTDELRVIADFEEFLIDNILATGDLAYVEDDLETLLLYAQARIVSLEHGWRTDSKGVRIDQTAEIERARRDGAGDCAPARSDAPSPDSRAGASPTCARSNASHPPASYAGWRSRSLPPSPLESASCARDAGHP